MNSQHQPPQRTVLHVDDDESVLDLGRSLLEHDHPDLAVLRYADPDEALAALASTRVDCVVSDSIRLADGTPFVSAVRETDTDVPIVLFTGAAWDDVREVAERTDVAGYVRKGNNDGLAELEHRVDTVVDDAGSVEHPRTLEGGWTVLGRHDWTADVELSTRLVEMLTAHTGRDAETVDPLFETVDTDAVTALLAQSGPEGTRPRERPTEVRFHWGEWELRVTNEGLVALRALDE